MSKERLLHSHVTTKIVLLHPPFNVFQPVSVLTKVCVRTQLQVEGGASWLCIISTKTQA